MTGGNAAHTDDPDYLGGGMYNYRGSPTVANCTVSGNAARYLGTNRAGMGGGMYNAYSSPTVTKCTFSGNTADAQGLYGFGGGPHERLDTAAFALVLVGAAVSGLVPLGFRRR